MNILYISKLDGRPWIGPTYSVPNQVAAQTKYDNILWYNLVNEVIPEGEKNINYWRELNYYVDLQIYPDMKIKSLPAPFNKPDLIVVEQAYPYAKDKIRREIMQSGIPYVIIPRGEFTATAQNKKKLKKILGNFILGYYRFVNKASAIQCLTEQEKQETNSKWNKKKIVLPNGTILPKLEKESFNDSCIKAVFIGRIEPFQKGLDLFMQACNEIQNELRSAGVRISIYGSDQENKAHQVKKFVLENNMVDFITFNNPVFGKEKDFILKNSDVFILTSRFEGHPTGLLEALSYGLPAVITTGANMREEIEKYNAGWTSDITAEGIKDSLLSMISDKQNFNVKCRNARILAEKYTWDNIAERSHEEYLQLI